MKETTAEKRERVAAAGDDLLTFIGGEIDKLLRDDSGVPETAPDGEGSYQFPRRTLREIRARINESRGIDAPEPRDGEVAREL